MKANSNTQAMGTEKIPKLLAQLAIPAVVAQVVNLLYNIVDRIYIGHISGIGASALTGVGLFTPILMLLNAFAMLAGSGGAPKAAIAMGQQEKEKAEKIMGNCFALLLILAAILTTVFYLFAPQLLQAFGASEVTLPYAVEYARIYILGSVFVLVVLGMNPFITTQGFAKISMLTTVIGAVWEKDNSSVEKEKYATGEDCDIAMSGAWNIQFHHVVYREYSFDQFYHQSGQIWWRYGSRSHDHYQQRQPAGYYADTGDLPGRSANYQLQFWSSQ